MIGVGISCGYFDVAHSQGKDLQSWDVGVSAHAPCQISSSTATTVQPAIR